VKSNEAADLQGVHPLRMQTEEFDKGPGKGGTGQVDVDGKGF